MVAEMDQHSDRTLGELVEVARQVSAAVQTVISGKPDTFCSGADLHEIIKLNDVEQTLEMSRYGQGLFSRLANISKPTVCGINGVCLGGGLELALCCDRRIATNSDSTLLGLPEVRLHTAVHLR